MNDFVSVVDWSRAMFALTAIYHWLFVPLTLGLSVIVAIMETKFVVTGDDFWRRTTKFWLRLFGVNFAIGVATGLILEFEFGTNWSNYSYFVGDIFGAPLAIEGIFAFFIESTFLAVMFFGWNKVGRKTHLVATWLTAFGANLSALWILVANAWMQSPVGMAFNPATARNEMVDFWAVVFSPVAINKFFHTVTSSFVLAAIFVIGVSAWYLLRGRENKMAIRSMRLAAVFGLVASLCTIYTGDGSARQVAKVQPMKLAAMEGLTQGGTHVGLTLVPGVSIPSGLSLLSYGSAEAYVAGIDDLVSQGPQRIARGRVAIDAFARYKDAQAMGDSVAMNRIAAQFKDPEFKRIYFDNFGYGYLKSSAEMVPPVGLVFWSFRVMVFLGLWLMAVCAAVLWTTRQGRRDIRRGWLYIFLWAIPLAYLASQAGWVVCEVGRQPWTIQNLLPTVAAVSRLESSAVALTFWIFVALFTALLAAEVTIMCKQIKKGPADVTENLTEKTTENLTENSTEKK